MNEVEALEQLALFEAEPCLDPAQSTAPEKGRNWARTARRIGMAAILAVTVLPAVGNFMAQVASQAQEAHCHYAPDAPMEARDFEVDREKVADMEFAINLQQYATLSKELDNAQTETQLESAAQRRLKGFPLRFKTDLEPRRFGLVPLPESLGPKRYTPVDLAQRKTDTLGLFQSLSRVPASFLRALPQTDLFLIHDTYLDDEAFRAASTFTIGGFDDNSIVINADAPDTVWHELNHALQYSMCDGASYESDLGEFAEVNPPEFTYGGDSSYDRAKLYSRRWTVSDYAGTDAAEDVAETGSALLGGWFMRNIDRKRSGTISDKEHLVIRRQQLVEPNIGYYYRFLESIGDYDFPGDIAKSGNLLPYCFNKTAVEASLTVTIRNQNNEPIDIPVQEIMVNGEKTYQYAFIDDPAFTDSIRQDAEKAILKQIVAADPAEKGAKPSGFGYNNRVYGRTTINCSGVVFTSDR